MLLPGPPEVLRFADRLAARSHLFEARLDADGLIDRARGETAWSPPPAQVEALRVLVSSVEAEAALSLFGRAALRWDIARFLGNTRRLDEEEATRPGIAETRIDRPVFILGLPRSGTSFLHALMAQDPDTLAPRCWQTVYPYKPASRRRDRRIAQVGRQIALFTRIAPDLPSVHPIAAETPQECSEITAHTFRSLRFDTTFRVPSYLAWLDEQGHDVAYAFHARFLRHLQQQSAASGDARWVLKCPDHVFAFDAIRRTYPDARFVFVHRDPWHVLASVARLTEILRGPFTRRIDRPDIGRQVADRWVLGAQRIIKATEAAEGEGLPMVHVTHTALAADPAATVRRVYEALGLPMPQTAAARICAMIEARPDGGYGRNSYHPGVFGLVAERERERFAAYMDRFLPDSGAAREAGGRVQAA